MTESGDYPTGAEFNKDAPYNQVDPKEREFEVTISQSLSKTVTVLTSNYVEIEDCDENMDKCLSIDTSNTDWMEVYNESHKTPKELIKEFENLLNAVIAALENNKEANSNILLKRCKYLKSECENWCIDETEVVE